MIAPHTLSNFSYPPTLCQTSLTPPHFVKLLLPPHTLSNFQSLTKLFNLHLSFTYPSLILHLSFTYPSLILRLSFAYYAPHTLSNFQSLTKLFNLRLSFVTYSAVPARRLSFAYPSLKVRPRWRKLAACAQFKIHNSKFIIQNS